MSVTDDNDLDKLVEIIAERVRQRLSLAAGSDLASSSTAKRPGAGDCLADHDHDHDHDHDCTGSGACVVRRPWSVRAGEQADATRVAAPPEVGAAPGDFAALIDHTLLKPDATRTDIETLCAEARKYSFASVCVNTTWVPLCKQLLRGCSVKVCCVVGFPLGAMAPTAKAYEARDAVRQGADEIDMVMNIGAIKSRDYELVFEDMSRVVRAAAPALVKVILETSALQEQEKIIACTLAKLSGAHFVKTSTGFGSGGATVEDVALMRKTVGAEMGVKASGGVRSTEDAAKLAQAGATRLGASASIAIVTGKSSGSRRGNY